jgi:hypothetical protein
LFWNNKVNCHLLKSQFANNKCFERNILRFKRKKVRKRIFFLGCNDEAFFFDANYRKENESTAIKRFTDERQNSVPQISDSQFQNIF